MKKYTIDQLDAYGLHNALEYIADLCEYEDITWENRDSLIDYAQRMGFWFDENGDRL